MFSVSDSSTWCFLNDNIDLQGTWQFMAADLIENPKINQTFIHDIESAFFVLLWMATHYVQANLDSEQLSGLISSVFDPGVFGSSGKPTKVMFMRDEQILEKLDFPDNLSLTQLLHGLKEVLGVRHRKQPEAPPAHHLNVKDMIYQRLHGGAQESQPSLKIKLEDQRKEHSVRMSALEDHDFVISFIAQAIEDTTWPVIEPAKRQVLVLSDADQWIVRSGSKRCRETALECEGGDTEESLLKRNKSL